MLDRLLLTTIWVRALSRDYSWDQAKALTLQGDVLCVDDLRQQIVAELPEWPCSMRVFASVQDVDNTPDDPLPVDTKLADLGRDADHPVVVMVVEDFMNSCRHGDEPPKRRTWPRQRLLRPLVHAVTHSRVTFIGAPPCTGKTVLLQILVDAYADRHYFRYVDMTMCDRKPGKAAEILRTYGQLDVDAQQDHSDQDQEGKSIVVIDHAHKVFSNGRFWQQLLVNSDRWLHPNTDLLICATMPLDPSIKLPDALSGQDVAQPISLGDWAMTDDEASI